ncbi:hypothetical protein GCM10025331_13670 [Actinoplanes utahensis]|nr:hypothetical protein Aut01nite_20880 [Actinoplanes utahensis]
MAAGASAIFVVVGGGVAGVATMTGPRADDAAQATAEPDLGAPMLEENPEVVSRAAAAAQPLPRRHAHTTAPAVTVPALPPPPPARTAPVTDQLSRARVADERADRTGPRSVRTPGKKTGGPAPRKQAAAPVVTTRTDVETRPIPFHTQVVRDASLPRGTRRVQVDGMPGEQTTRYLVTLTDGRQTARRLLGSDVTKPPQHRVVALGARRQSALDPACEQALNLCVPLGRSAVCPPGADAAPAEPAKVEESGEILIAEEDLELLGPEGLDALRLEPAKLC